MKLFYDFFPIILFFIGYKFLGIYSATVIAIIASLLQVIIYRLYYKRIEKMQFLSFILILLLGSATLFFHNPWFIKCKPTAVYWLLAGVLLISSFITPKPLIQHLIADNISLPAHIWRRLNYLWAIFFGLLGGINLYIAYFFSTNAWVNFKLFGVIGLTLCFILLQACYLNRHLIKNKIQPTTQDLFKR